MKTTINLEELKALDPCDDGKAFKDEFGNKTVTFSQAAKVMRWGDVWWCIRELWGQFTKQQQDDIHLLGCKYAEEVLYIFEEKYPDDKRPRLAIEAKRKWVKGEISDKELEEVRSAAWSAAAGSAWAAAWSAAESAESAELAAAGSARAEARAAAESAESAWAAAWAARTTKQKDMLINVLIRWEKQV